LLEKPFRGEGENEEGKEGEKAADEKRDEK